MSNKKSKTKRKTTVPSPVSVDMVDREWMAKNDARTLADAKTIQQDKKRLAAATKAAQKMAEEKKKEADAMASVAKKG